jgi:hypothetical protein
MHDFGEARHLLAAFRRIVGTAVEGPTVGSTEDREGPATLSRHAHNRVHVDLVHVRALFAVHLDVDEESVHLRGDFGVLE